MASVINRFINYALLMRLNRPIGIFLLLWPTLWALWIAGEGHPDMLIFIVFVLGVILMRSAGCVINDYADRKIDPLVRRTRNRPIAAGRVTPKEALTLFIILCSIAFSLVLLLNWLTIALSLVAILLAAIYPFMKRITYMPQVVLGLAFAWAIPMVFAAQTGSIPLTSWLLFTATVLWTVAYDTMYAMVDRADDIKIGVKSTAILFGDGDRWFIGGIQLSVFVILVLLGRQLTFGLGYYLGIVIAVLLAIYQQYLIRNRDTNQCFKAFLNNNWFGVAIFLGVLLNYSWPDLQL